MINGDSTHFGWFRLCFLVWGVGPRTLSVHFLMLIDILVLYSLIIKRPAPAREPSSLITFIPPICRVNFVWIRVKNACFFSHATAKLQLKLLSVCNRKACISVFSSKYRLFNSGGQRGIRTLDTLLTYTRVPVVRLRPAQPSVHYGASNGTWTHTSFDTRPSNVPVCLFQHTRKSQ